MTDLRKAAEQALEAFEMLDRRGGLGLDVHDYIRTKIEALRQALAQPEQEPVGTYQDVMQKMLALRHGSLEQMQAYDYLKNTPLYTAPPKREWVELTDEELQDIAKNFSAFMTFNFARAIEAKLKEKNHGRI